MNEAELSRFIVGDSPQMRRVRALVLQFARSSLPVLIQGPTGSGKERVAEAIHRVSGRRGKHVSVNVCAIPESLFEATLFGQVRGAFTGAIADIPGHFAEANGGTIFLDEIGSLPSDLQAKLLRVLDLREYRPVGGSADRRSDFRVVAADHQDLFERVEKGDFRLDLLYRLSGVVIQVPALDERREDIAALIQHFAGGTESVPQGAIFTDDALQRLQDHPWPGSIRQLMRAVERAMICATEHIVDSALVDDVLGGVRQTDAIPGFRSDAERELRTALGRNEWRIERTAEYLGIHRSTVFRQMRKLNIPRRMPPAGSPGS
jgi:DNA-binding NtrC family response regulator